MASGQENATGGFVLANDVGRSGCRQDTILSDNELGDGVGSTNPEDDLDGLRREVTTISANDNRRTLRVDRVKNGLDKVLRVVLRDS